MLMPLANPLKKLKREEGGVKNGNLSKERFNEN